jgi:glycerol kinase
MPRDHVLVVDQGTTGTTTMLFDARGRVAARAYAELPQHFPEPGQVEHDPLEILVTVTGTIDRLLGQSPVGPDRIAGLGITNQRETTLLWDRRSGEPLHRAIVWQDRRTTDDCERLLSAGLGEEVARRTGLRLDPYFSATKIRWLLDHHPGLRARAERGEIAFGTVDTWLLWQLTGGEVHATDWTNASRTMLYNIDELRWDDTLLEAFDIPAAILPRVEAPAHLYGPVTSIGALRGIPVASLIGDQQAALAGQACFRAGEAKNTYGTGAFVVMNLGRQRTRSSHGLLTTLAVGDDLGPAYALEGSVFIAGAAVQWLRDGLGLIRSAGETEALARAVPDNGGVYLVPAFAGLGAPHWEPRARGALSGLTRGATRNHVVRAALECMAYQSLDVFQAMESDSGVRLLALRVDGGAVANDFLMQFQADILDREVHRPRLHETTAFGAACLAGLATGVWPDTDALRDLWQADRVFVPAMEPAERERLLAGWRRAVAGVLSGAGAA